MVNTRARPSKDTGGSRAAILEAAMEAFMDAGFAGARVDEIALKAAANKAMIYYHFGSKQGVYRAVLLHLFTNVLDEVNNLRTSEAAPRTKLRALYTHVAALFDAKPALPRIVLHEILAGGQGMDTEVSRTLFSILSFVSETIVEGRRRGDFGPVHPVLLHWTIMTPLLVHYAGASFRQRLLARDTTGLVPGPDDMLVHLLQVLDRTLAPEPASRSKPGKKLQDRKRKTK